MRRVDMRPPMPRPPSYTEMSKLLLLDESRRVAAAEQPLIPEPKMATLMRSFFAAENARDVVLRIMVVIVRVRSAVVVNVVGMSLANTSSLLIGTYYTSYIGIDDLGHHSNIIPIIQPQRASE